MNLRLPCPENTYGPTNGAWSQFQGKANYGQIGRGAVGPSKVKRYGTIDEANHAKNVIDSAGGQFQARGRNITRASCRGRPVETDNMVS